MTGISSLDLIHKRGLFGNHQKKNENELSKISELKDLKILHIAQFKKSDLNSKNILIDKLNLPESFPLVEANENTRILWLAPKTHIIISKNLDILKESEEVFNKNNFGITDISSSRTIVQLEGVNAKEILKKGCPLNFNTFKKNTSSTSLFHGITIIIDLLKEDPYKFNLLCLRSFAESFYHAITDASLEYGYIGK